MMQLLNVSKHSDQ